MSWKDTRKGMTNYEVNSSLAGYIAFEVVALSGGFTWIAYDRWGWNWLGTFIISFFLLLVLSNTVLYKIIGFLISATTAVVGYFLGHYIIQVTGGGKALQVIVGFVIGILGFLITYGAREASQEFYDDIE